MGLLLIPKEALKSSLNRFIRPPVAVIEMRIEARIRSLVLRCQQPGLPIGASEQERSFSSRHVDLGKDIRALTLCTHPTPVNIWDILHLHQWISGILRRPYQWCSNSLGISSISVQSALSLGLFWKRWLRYKMEVYVAQEGD